MPVNVIEESMLINTLIYRGSDWHKKWRQTVYVGVQECPCRFRWHRQDDGSRQRLCWFGKYRPPPLGMGFWKWKNWRKVSCHFENLGSSWSSAFCLKTSRVTWNWNGNGNKRRGQAVIRHCAKRKKNMPTGQKVLPIKYSHLWSKNKTTN